MDSDRPVSAKAFLASSMAAISGGAVWAYLAIFTDHEVGYVAWGIGALVGLCALAYGGRGSTLATTCAVLTAASIFSSKVGATHHALSHEVRVDVTRSFSRPVYEDMLRRATAFTRLGNDASDDEIKTFMVRYGYTDSISLTGISRQEQKFFESMQGAELRRMHVEQPTYTEWRKSKAASLRMEKTEERTLLDRTAKSFTMLELVCGGLGVATAFGLVTLNRKKD